MMHKLYKIDEKKIELAIADFESQVDFELVPVITPKSSYVQHIGWMISLILLVLFIFTIDLVFYDSWANTTWLHLAAPFAAIIIGHWVDRLDWIDRWFISKPERNRQCFEKAQRLFFLRRLHETKTHNALMVFISIMEKRIVLVHDPRTQFDAINQLEHKLLEALKLEFKKSNFEQGLLQAIQLLKTELAPHFPKNKQSPESKNTNEIPNKLIWWD